MQYRAGRGGSQHNAAAVSPRYTQAVHGCCIAWHTGSLCGRVLGACSKQASTNCCECRRCRRCRRRAAAACRTCGMPQVCRWLAMASRHSQPASMCAAAPRCPQARPSPTAAAHLGKRDWPLWVEQRRVCQQALGAEHAIAPSVPASAVRAVHTRCTCGTRCTRGSSLITHDSRTKKLLLTLVDSSPIA